MKISDFTLGSLGLKGNYLVSINYYDHSDIYSEFNEFLNKRQMLQCGKAENQLFVKSEKPKSGSVLPQALDEPPSKTLAVTDSIKNISYKIFRQSKESIPARKKYFIIFFIFVADVPDSFFEMTKEELLQYQRGLQNISKSMIEKPFVSAKFKLKTDNIIHQDGVTIKLVFSNQIYVQANFPLNWTIGSILEFVRTVILESCENNIELCMK